MPILIFAVLWEGMTLRSIQPSAGRVEMAM